MIHNDTLELSTISIADISVSGPIGSSINTIDISSSFNINQTTPNISLNFPNPINAKKGLIGFVQNTGSVSFQFSGVTIAPGNSTICTWSGTQWLNLVGFTGADFWKTAGTLILPDGNTDYTESIRRDGYVGINDNPTSPLTVSGTNTIASSANEVISSIRSKVGVWSVGQSISTDWQQNTTTRARQSLIYSGGSNDWGFRFNTFLNSLNSTPVLTLTGSNFAGINTPTPQANLHVLGNSIIDSNIAADSGVTLSRLTSVVAPVDGAGAIGVTSSGKIVRHTTDLYRDRGMPNTLMTLSGVATFSRTNFLKWTRGFFILGGGRGASTLSTAGFYQITMPAVGTVISRLAGGNNITVTSEGIQMRDPSTSWSVLYYILNPGGSNSNNDNFRLVGYQSDFIVPDNWVMIATYNPDTSTIKIGNGQILAGGTDSIGSITPFDATVDFAVNTNPNTAGTTFTPNTPINTTVIYVSALNGAQWTYNGTAYIAAPVQPTWQTTGNAGTVQTTNFLGTTDNVGLSLRTSNQIRQTITAAGDFGFGITTPVSRASISGGNYDLGFYNGTPASLNQGKLAVIKAINLGTGQGHLAFETYRGGFGGGERMRITEAGNVIIGGTTTNNKFHVFNYVFNPNANDLASIKVEGNYGGGVAFAEGANRALIWSDAGRTLNFSTGGTAAGTPERMRITDTGNVVINGAFGTEKLHVNGNIRVTAVPNFATTALAMVSPLVDGCMYTVTVNGAKQLFLK